MARKTHVQAGLDAQANPDKSGHGGSLPRSEAVQTASQFGRWLPVLLYIMVVAGLSLAPARSFGAFRALSLTWLPADKLIHFFMYAILAGLLLQALQWRARARWGRVLGAIGFCIGFGVLLEILQGAIPPSGRAFSWGDIAANTGGVLAAGLLLGLWHLYREVGVTDQPGDGANSPPQEEGEPS